MILLHIIDLRFIQRLFRFLKSCNSFYSFINKIEELSTGYLLYKCHDILFKSPLLIH